MLIEATGALISSRSTGPPAARKQGDVPYGTAGPPVGAPQGSLVDFGRYSGWTIGQIKRADVDYLEWLMHVPMGRRFKDEIGALIGRKTA